MPKPHCRDLATRSALTESLVFCTWFCPQVLADRCCEAVRHRALWSSLGFITVPLLSLLRELEVSTQRFSEVIQDRTVTNSVPKCLAEPAAFATFSTPPPPSVVASRRLPPDPRCSPFGQRSGNTKSCVQKVFRQAASETRSVVQKLSARSLYAVLERCRCCQGNYSPMRCAT